MRRNVVLEFRQDEMGIGVLGKGKTIQHEQASLKGSQ